MKKIYSILLLMMLSASVGYSQLTYLSTPLVAGNGSGGISFNVTAHQSVFIEDVKATFTGSGTAEVWYNTTAISGPPTVSTAGGWTQLITGAVTPSGTGNATSVGPTSLLIPAGSTFGFFVGGVGVSYTNGTLGVASPYTDGIITIECGALVGYGGGAPNPTFHVRQFNGSLGYRIASTSPNDAATTDVFSNLGCPGSDTVYAEISNFGIAQIDSVWINWSKNGTLQTPIHYIGVIDTFGGTGANSVNISLGAHSFTAGVTDTFEVWTTMPNGVVDTTTYNDSNFVYLKPSLPGGTYTIGGASPDYATFAAAVADLNSIGVCGPVVFNVRQGTYNEQISVGNILGSSSVNTITFQSDPSNTAMPLIQATGNTAANYIWDFGTGAQYITIDSLHLKALGFTYSRVISILGSSDYLTVNDCWIEGDATSTTTSSFAMPFYQSGGLSNHNTITNNTITGGAYSLYLRGTNTTSRVIGNVIKNNTCTGAYGYQAYLYALDSLTFEGNTFEQKATSTAFTYGIYGYYCNNSVFSRNEVILHTTSTNYAFRIGRCAGGSNEISNNMIVTSENCGGTAYGLYEDYNLNMNVYHNSVNVRSGSGASTRALYVSGAAGTLYGNVNYRNNIFVNSVSGGYASYVLSGASTGYISQLDNNIYHTTGATQFLYGTGYANFAAYQTGSLKDSNSYFGVPGFISATDLHLQGALAADSGANLGIMIDIDGDVRPIAPSTGYDIGADEYIPPTCPAGYGVTAFNLTAFSADITWTVGIADTGWFLEYGPPGFTPGTGTSQYSNNDTATISGLTAVTDYDVYVRGICSAGDTSIYFGPVNFKTRCVSAMSGIYTINGTIPTGGVNYNSFGDAMNALNICGISGPTIFHVKQGTYTEQVSIGSIVGTSSTDNITFTSDPTNTAPAILTFSSSLFADNYVLRFDGAEHIVFDDLTITATGATYARVIEFPTTGDDITVNRCILNGSTGTSTSNARAVVYGATGTANLVHNVTFDSCDINNGSYTMYMYGGTTGVLEKHITVTNNNFNNFSYYGPYFYYSDSLIFDNNTITQLPTSTSFSYGIYTYRQENATVTRNLVTLNTTSSSYGMYAGYYGGTDNLIANNMLITSDNTTGTSYGLWVNYCLNTKVYHNSINVRAGNPTSTRAYYHSGFASALYGNVDTRNNIFVNSAGGYAGYWTTGGVANIGKLDYNIYNTAYTSPFYYGTGASASFAAYQTASLKDSNSYFSQPGFFSQSDLHLQGVVAFDNAIPVGVMNDVDGDARPLGPTTGYDIGADEYIPPTCPSPYSLAADTITTTSATFSWTNGPADSSWEIQYGTPGFALGTGTTINSGTNPTVLSGLTHSTCYEVWLRSICTVGDTSLWTGPFYFCTECAAVSDYCTDFDSGVRGETPFCWKTFVHTTSSFAYLETSTVNANSAPNCVRMYNQNDASAVMILVAPQVTTTLSGTHRMNVNVRADTTVVVGTMSDPANPGTFVAWDTLQGLSSGSYVNFKIPFTTPPVGHTAAHTYPAILWIPGATYDYVHIDDYCWEEIPSCEKAPAVTILNSGVDSTYLKVGWNNDTTTGASPHVGFMVAYGPPGYDPVSNPAGGDTVNAAFNLKDITGLNPSTEYCVWVKAICANGDSSIWSGPHCGETGCASKTSIPYAQNFTNYTTAYPLGLPSCWEEATGRLSSSSLGDTVAYTNSSWTADGFGNVGTTGAARINLWSTNRFEWLVSPSINLGSNPNQTHLVEFDIAMTDYFNTNVGVVGDDDTLAFLISYDAGLTWKQADILAQWDTSNAPSNTGDHFRMVLRNKTGIVKFGFYATSNVSNEDNDWFIDNFSIKDTVFVGVAELSLSQNFKVYPNPNGGVFTIENEGNTSKSSVKLVDIQGRLVYENQINFAKNGRQEIQVNKLTGGVYILLIQSEGKLEQHRIVIE